METGCTQITSIADFRDGMSFGREGMLREGYIQPSRKQGIARCAIPIVELTGDKPIMPTRSSFVALESLR